MQEILAMMDRILACARRNLRYFSALLRILRTIRLFTIRLVKNVEQKQSRANLEILHDVHTAEYAAALLRIH